MRFTKWVTFLLLAKQFGYNTSRIRTAKKVEYKPPIWKPKEPLYPIGYTDQSRNDYEVKNPLSQKNIGWENEHGKWADSPLYSDNIGMNGIRLAIANHELTPQKGYTGDLGAYTKVDRWSLYPPNVPIRTTQQKN